MGINGQVAPHKVLQKFESVTTSQSLTTTTLGLRLRVERHLLNKFGDLKIKCTATIEPIYWKSSEESVQISPERSFMNFWNSAVPYSSSSKTISHSSSMFLSSMLLTQQLVKVS